MRYQPTILQRLVLGASFFIAALIAWRSFAEPTVFLASMDIVVTEPGGLNEIRGQYGGFFAALAGLLAAAFAGLVRPSHALMLLFVLFGGVFCGRIVSLLTDGFSAFVDYPPVIRFAHFMDAIGAVLSFLALRQGDKAAG